MNLKRDKFFPSGPEDLVKRIFNEKREGSIFGIGEQFFFRPRKDDIFKTYIYGERIDTPFGPAAGPHTQLAQNIVSAWLTGGRFIELKTIQVLDDIDVTKPCIDMRDEGYNCEWSQELSVRDSFSEYLKAWILIHIINWELGTGDAEGINTVFNMSAGYDLKGVKSAKVSGFIENMRNCKSEKEKMLKSISRIFPKISSVDIPDRISDSITISTMHGTPPDEIEAIGKHFISMGFNITIKFNPTLLGKEKVRMILNETGEFETEVPDVAFEHDPSFSEALDIINSLKGFAGSRGVFFGIKLTNTLETVNSLSTLPGEEKMVYMSGRALHPIAVSLAYELKSAIGDDVDISFSAGADAFNISSLLVSGLKPVTVASDLLKPGGYTRFSQYVEELRKKEAQILPTGKDETLNQLESYLDKVLNDRRYRKTKLKKQMVKGRRELGFFDCISPPCVEECSASQDIPGYLKLTAEKRFEEAYKKVTETNPFPSVTGLICDHKCQTRCTREYYDESLRIKDIKYFLSEYGTSLPESFSERKRREMKVAVVGAGPAGLTCAHYLGRAGVDVSVYEESGKAGGMIRKVIPPFRLDNDSLEKDLKRVESEGLKIHYGYSVDKEELYRLRSENNFVFLAAGTTNSVRLAVKGIDAPGVILPLDLLSELKSGKTVLTGSNIAIIGGGNTAFDVARSAVRALKGRGKVTLLYRRGFGEMPAEPEEIRAAMEEGVEVSVFTVPEEVVVKEGRVAGLICSSTRLTGMGKDGRPYPQKIEGTERFIPFDTVVPALGQKADLEYFGLEPKSIEGYENILADGNVVIGGDCGTGDKTVINAIGDGRRAAEFILGNISLIPRKATGKNNGRYNELLKKRALKIFSPLKEGIRKISPESAVKEAERCLNCDELCDLCVTVCPNRANISYEGETGIFMIPVFGKDTEKVTYSQFEAGQQRQVLHITDYCNHCGNCTTFCPTSGKPFMDKPRLAISEASYSVEDNVFFFSKKDNMRILLWKRGETEEKLVESEGDLIYSGRGIRVILEGEDLKVKTMERLQTGSSGPDEDTLFSMIYLMRNLPSYLIKE